MERSSSVNDVTKVESRAAAELNLLLKGLHAHTLLTVPYLKSAVHILYTSLALLRDPNRMSNFSFQECAYCHCLITSIYDTERGRHSAHLWSSVLSGLLCYAQELLHSLLRVALFHKGLSNKNGPAACLLHKGNMLWSEYPALSRHEEASLLYLQHIACVVQSPYM